MARKTASSKNSNKQQSGPRIVQLDSGKYVTIRSVSPFLINKVQSTVKDPDIPITILEDGSEYPNTNDPNYAKALAEASAERDSKSFQAIIYFGMKLCNEEGEPIEPPEGWDLDLEFMGIDWKSDFRESFGDYEGNETKKKKAEEMAYLQFIAFTAADVTKLNTIVGMGDLEAVEDAQGTFRR